MLEIPYLSSYHMNKVLIIYLLPLLERCFQEAEFFICEVEIFTHENNAVKFGTVRVTSHSDWEYTII
jgi:hypothetical protein